MLCPCSNSQNKENSIVKLPSKARTISSEKNYRLESKLKVFVAVGNIIRAFGTKRDNLGNLKTTIKHPKKIYTFDASKEVVWPGPECLSPFTTFKDNYEDCWPLEYRLSEICLLQIGDYRGKGRKPMPTSFEDGPLPLVYFHQEDDSILELFLEPVVDEIPPPTWFE